MISDAVGIAANRCGAFGGTECPSVCTSVDLSLAGKIAAVFRRREGKLVLENDELIKDKSKRNLPQSLVDCCCAKPIVLKRIVTRFIRLI